MNAVDTNVFVYSLDVHEPAKHSKAKELLAGLNRGTVQALDHALADMQKRAEALVASRTDVPRTYRLRGGRNTSRTDHDW